MKHTLEKQSLTSQGLFTSTNTETDSEIRTDNRILYNIGLNLYQAEFKINSLSVHVNKSIAAT